MKKLVTQADLNLKNKIADVVAIALNAPLIALIVFTILLYHTESLTLASFLVVFGFSMILPIALIYLLRKRGTIPDMYASLRETRKTPLILVTAIYLGGFLTLLLLKVPPIISALMLCYSVNTLFGMIVSFKWKISIHVGGVALPTTALVFWFGALAWPSLLLIVPIAWARAITHAHTLTQVIVGAVITVVATYIQLYLYIVILN